MATWFDNTGNSSSVFRPGTTNLYDNLVSDSMTKTTPSGQTLLSSKGVNINAAGSGRSLWCLLLLEIYERKKYFF